MKHGSFIEWHIGSHRFVLMVGTLVIKFPRIRLFSSLPWLYQAVKAFLAYKPCNIPPKQHHDGVCTHSRKGSAGVYLNLFRRLLFEGFIENFREARLYFKTRHKLLPVVYLPLVLFNVSARKHGVGNFTYVNDEMIHYEEDSAGLEAVIGHTFKHKENFAYDGKQVWLLDSGAEEVDWLVANFADKIEATLLTLAGPPPE